MKVLVPVLSFALGLAPAIAFADRPQKADGAEGAEKAGKAEKAEKAEAEKAEKAEKGVYLEEELVRTEVEGPPRSEIAKTWMTSGKLRKEQPSTGTVTIVREDRKSIWVIDERARTWFELDRASLDRMGEMGMAVLTQSKDEDPSKWLVKTGREKKLGAWRAYEVKAEDRPLPGTRISIWLSKDVPIEKDLRRGMMGEAFGASNPGAQLLAGLRDLDGYPVEVELEARIGAHSFTMRQTLKKVDQVEIAANRFTVPEGFQRIPSPFEGILGANPAAPPPSR